MEMMSARERRERMFEKIFWKEVAYRRADKDFFLNGFKKNTPQAKEKMRILNETYDNVIVDMVALAERGIEDDYCAWKAKKIEKEGQPW